MFSSSISGPSLRGNSTAALKNKKQNSTIKLLRSHVHIISLLINAHAHTHTDTYTHTHTYTNKVCLYALLSSGDGRLGSHSTQIGVSMLTDVTTHCSPHVLIVPLQNETCPHTCTNDIPDSTACFVTKNECLLGKIRGLIQCTALKGDNLLLQSSVTPTHLTTSPPHLPHCMWHSIQL